MSYWIGERSNIITLSGEGQPPSSPFPDPDSATPQEKTRTGVAGFLKLIGSIGVLVATIFLLISAYFGCRIYSLLSTWQHVEAEVVACEVYPKTIVVPTSRTHPRSTVYGFRCEVAYSAGSQTYQSEADIGYQKSDAVEMTRWTTRFYPGLRTPIAYKPDDPTHIRFAGDFTTAYAPALMFFPVIPGILIVCILIIAVAPKLRPKTI